MTHASERSPLEVWESEFANFWSPALQPQATQDADLLRQLGFVPGFKEILTLRQVHALEHATVWVLGLAEAAIDDERLSGLSTDRGFYLYGDVDPNQLRRAVQTALRRITSGDWDLAVHPRCGTNLSVGMLLTASFAIGASVLLPRDPVGQIFGLGMAATIAAQLAPDLGNLAQRYVTTAIPFNLAVDRITFTADFQGRPAHFVQVHWIESDCSGVV